MLSRMRTRKACRSRYSARWVLVLFALLIAAAAFNEWLARQTDRGPWVGSARVIDGDTFDLCEGGDCRRIRLCGINTPERDMPGYTTARQALVELTRGQDVRCTPVGSGTVCDHRSGATSHERSVAQCGAGAIADLGGELVRRGHACDLTGFTRGYYRDRFGGRPC